MALKLNKELIQTLIDCTGLLNAGLPPMLRLVAQIRRADGTFENLDTADKVDDQTRSDIAKWNAEHPG